MPPGISASLAQSTAPAQEVEGSDLRSQLPPDVFGVFRFISIVAGAVFTYTGKAWVRFHGWVFRAKEPKWFWWEVALYFLCGVGLIGYFLLMPVVDSPKMWR